MSLDNNSGILLSIAICTYNRATYLRDTIAELAKQHADRGQVEILVVNNNSSDQTNEVLYEAISTHPGLTLQVVQESQQGLSHARNRALQESTGQFVLFIDDDVFLPDNFVESWVGFLKQQRTIAAAGGPIDVHFDDGQPAWFPMLLRQMLGYHRPFRSNHAYPKNMYPHGGNMAVNREKALEINGFDTRLGRTGKNLAAGEEKDFFKRLMKVHPAVYYNAGASLRHRVGKDRMTKAYIQKQAIGIGMSDRVSTESGNEKLKWALNQAMKIGGSLILGIGYLLGLSPAKAWYLIKFRFWVISGFLMRQGEKSTTS
jgi:glycosyltransferase involved in cell wall biosynthesis